MPPNYKQKPSPGMGRGVFAARALATGTLIMRDEEKVKVPTRVFKPHNAQNFDPTQDAFDRLSPSDQGKFLDLHEGNSSLPTKVQRIYQANAFASQDGQYNSVYLNISKVNHSCTPNAEIIPDEHMSISKPRLVAIKPIAVMEEVTITYSAFLNLQPRNVRQEWLRKNFDFTCNCATCRADSHTIALSDARRKLLSAMVEIIHGGGSISALEATRQEVLSKPSREVAAKWQSLLATAPRIAKCCLSLLMARLLEGEDLPIYQAGTAYLDAATCLLLQMEERKDGIVPLGAADNVHTWLEDARRIIATLHGANSTRGKEVTQYKNSLDFKCFELSIAKGFNNQKSETIAAIRRNPNSTKLQLKKATEAFALQFVWAEGTPCYKPILEEDCKNIVRQYRIDPAAMLESARAMEAYKRYTKAS